MAWSSWKQILLAFGKAKDTTWKGIHCLNKGLTLMINIHISVQRKIRLFVWGNFENTYTNMRVGLTSI
jgi:hypothetical protein